MDASQWKQVDRLFNDALEQPEDARDAWLDQACADAPELRAEVRGLLEAHARAGAFLDEPATLPVQPPPSHLGAWRVVRELGRGGMGTVYLAERDDGAFTMQAAVKLLRRGLDTDDVLARFRDERQILASLQHPNIARLLDGGATDDGRPWLAMEYIDGVTLLDFARDRGLDTAAKLALFRRLAEAVAYAHRNLVVHRDLKPANVLVTPDGEPRLLDFGIAKVLTADGEARTHTGAQLLTPAWASPEQLRGERVTTAADVWALGVILYELLTGRRPFEGSGQTQAAAITSGELPPPRLGPELDAILHTALRKEPQLRYPSVEAFADDVSRLGEGLPLRARPPTAGYRLGKFIRRNRLAVGAAALLGLSLGAGVIATTLQAREARAARARAEAAQTRAEELVDFMLGDLREKLAPTNSLEVLDDVVAAAEAYFAALPSGESSPERRARLLTQLATVRLAQSKTDEAEALATGAREALRGAPTTPEARLLEASAENLRGQVEEARGNLEAALTAFEASRETLVALQRAAPGDAHLRALTADAWNNRGRLLYFLGQGEVALEAHEAAAALLGDAMPGSREPGLARSKTLLYLGRAREALGRFGEAEADFRANVGVLRGLVASAPGDHEMEDSLAIGLNDLGRVLRLAGRPAEAEPFAAEAVELSARALERDPGNTIRMDGLAASHASLGRAREALGTLEPALKEYEADVAIAEQLLAREPDNAFAQAALGDGLTNVGRVRRKLGQLKPAREAHERALGYRRALAEKDDGFAPDLAKSLLELGRLQRQSGEDASGTFEAAREALVATAGAADAPAKLRGLLAQALLEAGRLDEARPIVEALRQADAVDAELLELATARGL